MQIFWDGSEIAGSYDGTGSGLSYSSSNGSIGNRTSPTATRYINSDIDDIRVYNRALSSVEINALYQEGGWGN